MLKHVETFITPDTNRMFVLWPVHGRGSGSSQRATSSIGATFLHFLQGMQLSTDPTDPTDPQLSILDVGCGWGEWLPSMLLKALEERSLREDFVYFGLDIAEQPIESLRTRFGHTGHAFQFAATWMKQDETEI